MPKLAANLSMMYQEWPLVERFNAAAEDGFQAVEILFPYELPVADVAALLQENQLTLALFNTPPGNWNAGERGLASLPGREMEFQDAIGQALVYAKALGVKRIHCMAGLRDPRLGFTLQRDTYLRNLAWAAKQLAPFGIEALIEPINTRDIPGFFLNRQDEAHAICAEVGAPNLRVQMDLYHCQIVEGDVASKIKKYIAGVGHIQIAGVPARHEPNVGELNNAFLLALLDELAYPGYVGCEYRPAKTTREGLAWARDYLRRDA